jgi:hypothetical protein
MFVNADGREVIELAREVEDVRSDQTVYSPAAWSHMRKCTFSDGVAALGNHFIDKVGKIVLPPFREAVENYSEGLAPVRAGRKWGYLDRLGTIVIAPQFDRVGPFDHGVAWVRVGDKLGYIDTKGKYVWEPTR